jgi:UDP-glucose 4-epimerase
MKENNETILVTGGAGFIGSHLVAKLADRNYRIRILDNLSTGKLSNIDPAILHNQSVDFIEGDIRDSSLVSKCLDNVDIVVHLAAQISVPYSIQNPQLNDEVNIGGTMNLLNSSVENKIKRFVFISSCAVYGETVYLPIDEKHPINPISPYATSKLVAEKECLNLNNSHLLKSVVLRFFNVYGPKQGLNDYSGVITKFMGRIKQRLPLTIYGDGSQTRDFVYVQDIVNSIVLAVERKDVDGEIFNIGTGKAVTIEELAKTMLSLTGKELEIIKVPIRKGDIKHSYANISKASKLLGYNPQFSLNEGLTNLLSQNGLLT